MHTAAAHGAQRLTVQRQAGSLRFSVDNMGQAAQVSECGGCVFAHQPVHSLLPFSGEQAAGATCRAVSTYFKARKHS